MKDPLQFCVYCRQPLRLFLDPRPGPAPRPNMRCDCKGYLAAIRDGSLYKEYLKNVIQWES